MNSEYFVNVEEENSSKEKKDSLNKSSIENVADEVIKLIITSLGFVTALAWNDAFQRLFKKNKYLVSYGPWVYAILITIITVLIITKVRPWFQRTLKNGTKIGSKYISFNDKIKI